VRLSTLIRRGLFHYWRTNLAVIAGVATAVSVLGGALLVGESVRDSLRNLVVERLGSTDQVIAAGSFFREELTDSFSTAVPLIQLEGIVIHQTSGLRATGIQVYGIDERFWQFHQVDQAAPERREVYLSPSLARELAAADNDGILLRVEKPSYIPAESLHGRKSDAARTVRFSFAGALLPENLGEFSLQPQQGAVRAAFVSLDTLQDSLEQPDRVNTLLLGEGETGAEATLRDAFALEDLGLKVDPVDSAAQLESEAGMLSDSLVDQGEAAAAALNAETQSVLTYLANTLRIGSREVPYSLIAAVPPSWGVPGLDPGKIVLNQWAAQDLAARTGEPLTLEYYLWRDDGGLVTETADFEVGGIIPTRDQRELAPDYPGITDVADIVDWDPPFPMDLGRIRPRDEDYWDRYQATPKAYVTLADGQRLWESRFGKVTALRAEGANPDAFRQELRDRLDPFEQGFMLLPVREQSLGASAGATDFGEYFVYFSFFLVVSALMLAGLFFRLGLEQRVRETGLLESAGYPARTVRRIFLREGAVLAAIGCVIGMAGAAAYAWVIVYGLRTWWVGAVGTQMLSVNVSPVWMFAGAVGGFLAALAAIALTLRSLRRISPKDRLAGVLTPGADVRPVARRAVWIGAVSLIAGLAMVATAALGLMPQVGGFFGAGTLLLIALLAFFRARLARTHTALGGNGGAAVARLGARNASFRPGRAVLSVALIASATFIIVAVDAFRFTGEGDVTDPASGSGGYRLMAEALLPLYYDPATPQGRRELGLGEMEDAGFVSFRLRPGDDVSCLNLYQPQNPRVLGAPEEFLEDGRFTFQSSLAETPEERANPWLLLEEISDDGAIPAAVAANSLQYILHRALGDEFVLNLAEGRQVRFRLVAALADTVFQRELIISEENFQRQFPNQEGYRVFLLNGSEDVGASLEESLADYGFDVRSTAEQLAEFHRVENTYLSTFQTLGALGLLLGTVGLAVILLRNVLERRRELALLRAVGYKSGHLALMVLSENLYLLVSGLFVGVLTALIAIAPAFATRGGGLTLASLGSLLVPVLITGVLASVLATVVSLRSPLLEALRAE